jgi:hypothetical protein
MSVVEDWNNGGAPETVEAFGKDGGAAEGRRDAEGSSVGLNGRVLDGLGDLLDVETTHELPSAPVSNAYENKSPPVAACNSADVVHSAREV